MENYKLLATLLTGVTVFGCAPIPVSQEARSVELVNEKPDSNKCQFVGEIVGS